MNDEQLRTGLARMSKSELINTAADLYRKIQAMTKPAELRKAYYPPLSALTIKTLGPAKQNLSAEIQTVQNLIDYHEQNEWRELSQDDYDTLYPELTAYLDYLRSKKGA